MTQIHFHLNFNTDKYISVGSVPKTTGLGFLVLYELFRNLRLDTLKKTYGIKTWRWK